MAMESEKKSPWPLRLLVVSMACFVLGSIIVLGQMSTFDDALNPERNNVASLEVVGSGAQEAIDIDSSGCYRAYGVSFNGDVTLSKLNGSDIEETVDESECKLDWSAMSTDGSVTYSILGSWELKEGSYLLRAECEETCVNETVWLTSIDEMESSLMSSPWVIIGSTMCCLGIFLLPLSGVILAFSQNRKQGAMMVVGPDGTLMPLSDLTPDVVQNQINAINQDTTEDIGFDVRTGEYMRQENNLSPQQMDGTSDVQSGSMLTTEQVYALMRGDVEAATPQEQNVADPFPTPAIQPKSTTTSVELTPKQQVDRKIPVAKNEDWQSWDED